MASIDGRPRLLSGPPPGLLVNVFMDTEYDDLISQPNANFRGGNRRGAMGHGNPQMNSGLTRNGQFGNGQINRGQSSRRGGYSSAGRGGYTGGGQTGNTPFEMNQLSSFHQSQSFQNGSFHQKRRQNSGNSSRNSSRNSENGNSNFRQYNQQQYEEQNTKNGKGIRVPTTEFDHLIDPNDEYCQTLKQFYVTKMKEYLEMKDYASRNGFRLQPSTNTDFHASFAEHMTKAGFEMSNGPSQGKVPHPEPEEPMPKLTMGELDKFRDVMKDASPTRGYSQWEYDQMARRGLPSTNHSTIDPTYDQRDRHEEGPSRGPMTRKICSPDFVHHNLRHPCIFCHGQHISDECPMETDVNERKSLLQAGGICTRCLSNRHTLNKCRNDFKECKYCGDRGDQQLHHASICELPENQQR